AATSLGRGGCAMARIIRDGAWICETSGNGRRAEAAPDRVGRWPRRIVLGAVLDRIARHLHVDFAVFPAHAVDRGGRNRHVPAGQPLARIDDEEADREALVVE